MCQHNEKHEPVMMKPIHYVEGVRLLVLSFPSRGFFPAVLVFPSPQKPSLPNPIRPGMVDDKPRTMRIC